MSSDDSLTVIRGACGHDCPDTCTWIVEARSGKAERLYGDPNHPFTRGTLCAKVNHYLERVYHPDRVLYPLKRTGKKGDGQFVRTTWDEALTDIAGRWKSIIAESGAEAILPYSFAGNQGLIQMASLGQRLFGLLGCSRLERALCGESPRPTGAATESIPKSWFIAGSSYCGEPTRSSPICIYGPLSPKPGDAGQRLS